jgi:hypothetical protein
VSGFFTLLCDEIDRSVTCPGNGRCCLTKKVEEGGSATPPRQTNRPTNRPTRDRFYESKFRPKTFGGIFSPQILNKMPTKTTRIN